MPHLVYPIIIGVACIIQTIAAVLTEESDCQEQGCYQNISEAYNYLFSILIHLPVSAQYINRQI